MADDLQENRSEIFRILLMASTTNVFWNNIAKAKLTQDELKKSANQLVDELYVLKKDGDGEYLADFYPKIWALSKNGTFNDVYAMRFVHTEPFWTRQLLQIMNGEDA